MQYWIIIDAFLSLVDAIADRLKSIRRLFPILMDKALLILFVLGITSLVAKIYSWMRGTDNDEHDVDMNDLDRQMAEEGHVVSKTPKSKVREATRNSQSKPNLQTPDDIELSEVPDKPKGARTVEETSEYHEPSEGIEIPAAPERTIKGFDEEIEKITKRHSDWRVGRGASDKQGSYPGCPSHGIQGTVDNYEACILLTINTLMSKAGLDLNAACGLTGCFMAESGLLPIAFNRTAGGYGAQGIAQWRSWYKDPKQVARLGTRGRIGNYVHLYGVMQVYDDNLQHQLDYVCWELANYPYLRVANGVSLQTATHQGFHKYEGAAGDPNAVFAVRLRCAQRAYNLYMSKHSAAPTTKTTKDKRVVSNKHNQ